MDGGDATEMRKVHLDTKALEFLVSVKGSTLKNKDYAIEKVTKK